MGERTFRVTDVAPLSHDRRGNGRLGGDGANGPRDPPAPRLATMPSWGCSTLASVLTWARLTWARLSAPNSVGLRGAAVARRES